MKPHFAAIRVAASEMIVSDFEFFFWPALYLALASGWLQGFYEAVEYLFYEQQEKTKKLNKRLNLLKDLVSCKSKFISRNNDNAIKIQNFQLFRVVNQLNWWRVELKTAWVAK